jgi:hypothetical protein
MREPGGDRDALDALTGRLYAAFRNVGGIAPAVETLYAIFLPDARIVRAVSTMPETMSLQAFVESRRTLLTDGTLVDFDEWEIDRRTEVRGHLAARWSLYRKVGRKDGVALDQRGFKHLQYVRVGEDWKIAALAWDDERPGFAPGERLSEG